MSENLNIDIVREILNMGDGDGLKCWQYFGILVPFCYYSVEVEVLSTEELCHEIGEVNRRISTEGMRAGPFQQAGGLIVGSSDVKSFYPEMDIEVVADELMAEVMESELELV